MDCRGWRYEPKCTYGAKESLWRAGGWPEADLCGREFAAFGYRRHAGALGRWLQESSAQYLSPGVGFRRFGHVLTEARPWVVLSN